MPTLSRRRGRPAALVALAAATVLGLSACGSSGGSSSAATPGGASGFEAYRQCLSEHGVTLPSGGPGDGRRPSGAPTGMPEGGQPPSGAPSGGASGGPGGGGFVPEGVDPSAFAAAQEACASLRPTGGLGGRPSMDSSQFQAYLSCLQDHGVTASSPADLRSLSTTDATVAKALETCAPLRPTLAPAPTASPTAA